MPEVTHVIKRSGAVVPYKKERIANAVYRAAVAVGGRDKEKAALLAEDVEKLLFEKCADGHVPHIEEVQDIVEKVLIENGHAKVAKEYILYRNERNIKRKATSEKASNPSENVPWAKIWRVLDWAMKYKLNTIEVMNSRIRSGEFPQIVHECEAAYEDNLDMAADLIIQRAYEIKMVFISGPSSSGKTTTTMKLEHRLKQKGLKFVALNVDNYFYDLEVHPKDEFGDYDFETPQALDLEMIDDHLRRLASGEEVKIPFYDFKNGKRHLEQTPMKLGENEILIIDCLHGLYPKMSEHIPANQKFKVYIEPLMQMKGPEGKYIRWTDIRLMRRMLRDMKFRAYQPQQTLEHWHYVRTSEMRHIIPYINSTDFIINSAMPYELAIYSAKLKNQFAEWVDKYKTDPLRGDAFIRASRVFGFLNSVISIEDESPIPGDSVIREFIGGSTLKY
ncbi:MAG: ATP cone domain-containing protein [bacterium]